MELCMGMKYSKRMLLGRDIVSQNQVELVFIPPLSGYGSDGIVRLSLGFRIDKALLIRVSAPRLQDPVSQFYDPVSVSAGKSDDGHGPLHYACCHIAKARDGNLLLHRRLRHGKFVVSALEMIMGEN